MFHILQHNQVLGNVFMNRNTCSMILKRAVDRIGLLNFVGRLSPIASLPSKFGNCYIVTIANSELENVQRSSWEGLHFIRQSLKCISLIVVCVLRRGYRRRTESHPPLVPSSRGGLCLRWLGLHERNCAEVFPSPSPGETGTTSFRKKSSWSLKRHGILWPPSVVQWGAEISGGTITWLFVLVLVEYVSKIYLCNLVDGVVFVTESPVFVFVLRGNARLFANQGLIKDHWIA